MAGIVTIKANEIRFLCKEVEAKFLALNPHIPELKKSSFKGSYADLEESFIAVLGIQNTVVSEGLLRKLFYDSIDKKKNELVPELSFNRGFLDSCYLYFSDGQKKRHEFLSEKKSQVKKEGPKEEKSLKEAPKPIPKSPKLDKTPGSHRVLLIALAVGLVIILGFGGIKWLLSGEGTKVQANILVSKFVGEKEDEGSIKAGEIKIGWYLKSELDKHLRTKLAKEVISDEEEALKMGDDENVPFVIWGEVLGIGEEKITLFTKFQIIQKPATASARDSVIFNNIDKIKRETFALGEPGSCEFQREFSEKWTCTALFAVGLFYYLEGDFPKAKGFFEQVLEACHDQNGDLGENLFHFYLGNCAYQQTDFNAAISSYRNALRLKKDDHIAAANLGCAFAEQAQAEIQKSYLDSALHYFNYSLNIIPDYALAAENLVKVTRLKTGSRTGRNISPPPDFLADAKKMDSLISSNIVPNITDSLFDELTGPTLKDKFLECLPKRSPEIPAALSQEVLRDSILNFADFASKQLAQWGNDSFRKSAAGKISHARIKAGKFDFIYAIPSVWSLYYTTDGQDRRVQGTPKNLKYFYKIPNSEVTKAQKRLEILSTHIIRRYYAQALQLSLRYEYYRADEYFNKALQVCALFETSSKLENVYDSAVQTPNATDRLKSKVFAAQAWNLLMNGKETKYCRTLKWAKRPGTSPIGFNKSYLRDYKLKNVNNVVVNDPNIELGLSCCKEFWGQ